MARTGWSASNYLRCTSAPVTAAPLTISAWGRVAALGTQEPLVVIENSASGIQINCFALETQDNVLAITADGTVGSFATSTTAITANTWFHACAVYTSNASRAAFLNGAGKGTNVTSRTPTGPNRTSIGVYDQSAVGAGTSTTRVAEVAIWNVALSDAEVLSLSRGVHPYLIRPSALRAYWPLLGTQDPEPNRFSNTATLGVIGTLSAGDHVRVFYPAYRSRNPFGTVPVQGLTAARFDETDTFQPAAIALGLTAGLYDEADTFYAGTVATSGVTTALTAGLFTESDSFQTATVTSTIGLAPSLHSDTDTFYAVTSTGGAVGLAAGLFTETDGFYAAAIAVGTTPLVAGLFTETDIVYLQTLGVGAVSLTPSLFTESDQFQPAAITTGAGDLVAFRFDDTDGFYATAITTSTINLAPGLFTDTDNFYESRNVAGQALGGVATASSEYNANLAASNTNSGSRDSTKGGGWGGPAPSSGWNDATAGVFPDFVEYVFTGAYPITEINVITLRDDYGTPGNPTATQTFTAYGITDFLVQYWDGSSWQTVPGGNIVANNLVWRRVQFPTITTSKIRIYITNAVGFGYSRLVEVEAWTEGLAVTSTYNLAPGLFRDEDLTFTSLSTAGELNSVEIDYTVPGGRGSVTVRDTVNPANVKTGIPVDDFLTNIVGATPKMVMWSDGLLRWTPHNLALPSEDFSTTWTLYNVTVTPNATAAYDGAVTADKIVEDATASIYHFAYQGGYTYFNDEPYTFSVDLKAAERTWAYVVHNNNFADATYFDLANGVMGTQASSSASSMVSLGNGWYRCTIKWLPVGGATYAIGTALANGVQIFTGTPGFGIYATRAQYTRGVADQPYMRTTTDRRAGVPIEYDPTTDKFFVNFEAADNNFLPQSRIFSDATYWTPTLLTVTANQTAGLDGLIIADKLTDSAVSGTHSLAVAALAINGNFLWTFSVFFRYINHQYVGLRIWDGFGVAAPAVFDILNGVVTNLPAGYASASIVPVGKAGWFRAIVSRLTDPATAAAQCHIYFADGPTYAGGAYAGTGTKSVYVDNAQFGFQLGFAGSVIQSGAGVVGRAGDNFNVSLSVFPWNNAAGSVIIENADPLNNGGPYWLEFLGADTTNWILLYAAGGQGYTYFVEGGVPQANPINLGAYTTNVPFRQGAVWALNDFAATVNGNVPVTDNLGTVPLPIQMRAQNIIAAKMFKVFYTARRISNFELQARTSSPITITGSYGMLSSLFTEADTFYPAAVTVGAVALTPGLFNDVDTFYASVLTAGAVNLAAPLVTETDTFYAATVTAGVGDLAAVRFDEASVFYAAAITVGTVNLSAAMFTEADNFYAAVLGKTYALGAALFTETDLLYIPTLSVSAVNLAPGLFTDIDSFYVPVMFATVGITAGFFTEDDTFYPAAMAVVVHQFLTPSMFTDDDIFPLFGATPYTTDVWFSPKPDEPHDWWIVKEEGNI